MTFAWTCPARWHAGGAAVARGGLGGTQSDTARRQPAHRHAQLAHAGSRSSGSPVADALVPGAADTEKLRLDERGSRVGRRARAELARPRRAAQREGVAEPS